ncbi:hypothetical protein [Tepidimonas sp.]|uniref:hypothetical protein n=1 Tax=Tepidimonas sp. TaxID=2002775 RepID=UPI002FE283F0
MAGGLGPDDGIVVPIGAPVWVRRLRAVAVAAVLLLGVVAATLTPGTLRGTWAWPALAVAALVGWSAWAARRPDWTALWLPEAASHRVGGHTRGAAPTAPVALGPAWPRGVPLRALRVVWDGGDTLLLSAVTGDGRTLWGWAWPGALTDACAVQWRRVRQCLVTGGAFRSAIFDSPAAAP